MHSDFDFLIQLCIILGAATVGGFLSKKVGQPAVLGQIVVGILLSFILREKSEFIDNVAEIGVIFLMFIAGLETDVNELLESGKSSSIIALGGVLIPGLMVFGGMYMLNPDNFAMAAFMGVVSTATSVSISVQTLREMSQLRTKQGISILGAAIIDDIVGIILLTFVVAAVKPGEGVSIGMTVIKILSFFGIAGLSGFLLTKICNYCDGKINIERKIVTYAVIVCFALAFLSENLGVAAITGSYFAGVMFSMTPHRHKVSHDINKIATLLFTPVFFVSIGMGVDLSAATSALGLGTVFIVLAVLGKLIGCGVGAKISGFDAKKSLQIGIGMIPRAEVAIIISTLGVKLEVIGDKEMAAVLLMVLVTTVLTPSLLKMAFGKDGSKQMKAAA